MFPRTPGVSLIYAHARRGMFLPLLSRSKISNGASLIGIASEGLPRQLLTLPVRRCA